MPIPFSCQQCGRNLRVKDELAGMQIYCPDCKGVLIVPRADDGFRSAVDSPIQALPAEPPKDDPYAARLQDVPAEKKSPPIIPEAEVWDESPPPKTLTPTRSFAASLGMVFGGIGLVLLSIIILVVGLAAGFLWIKPILVLFVLGVVLFFKGMFSRD
jgi:hypothetical protein